MPKRNLSVDETMIPYKGRVHFKQYMKAKPVKWGVKAWAMCESDTGYMVDMNIYCGKSDHTETGLTHKVVVDLVRQSGVANQGYTVFTDNLYTSPALLLDLYNNFGTTGCGTLRINRRGIPKEICCKKPLGLTGRGNYVFRCQNPLLAVTWMDKKAVHFMSTCHDVSATTCFRTERRNNKFVRVEYPQPNIAAGYTSYMGGVDRCDQFIQYYSFGRKTVKWTKRVFFKLLEISKSNALILYNQSPNHQPAAGKPKMTLLQFTIKMISSLIGGQQNPNKRGRPRTVIVADELRLTARHFPVRLPNKSWCHVCWRRVADGRQNTRRQSVFGCSDCGKHLCIPECFTVYHTVQNY